MHAAAGIRRIESQGRPTSDDSRDSDSLVDAVPSAEVDVALARLTRPC
jgi:hypothetical protein